MGGVERPRTNDLDMDSAMLYTKSMDEAPYKSNLNVFYSCHYHRVWCPKYRRKVLVQAVAARLKESIRQVCQEDQAEIEELEVMADHVHLLVTVDPRFGIHRLGKLIKGRRSRLLHQ
jgi:putative transposase